MIIQVMDLPLEVDLIFRYFNSNNSYFPHSYPDSLGKGRSIFSGDNNSEYFNLKEIEVFKLIKP